MAVERRWRLLWPRLGPLVAGAFVLVTALFRLSGVAWAQAAIAGAVLAVLGGLNVVAQTATLFAKRFAVFDVVPNVVLWSLLPGSAVALLVGLRFDRSPGSSVLIGAGVSVVFLAVYWKTQVPGIEVQRVRMTVLEPRTSAQAARVIAACERASADASPSRDAQTMTQLNLARAHVSLSLRDGEEAAVSRARQILVATITDPATPPYFVRLAVDDFLLALNGLASRQQDDTEWTEALKLLDVALGAIPELRGRVYSLHADYAHHQLDRAMSRTRSADPPTAAAATKDSVRWADEAIKQLRKSLACDLVRAVRADEQVKLGVLVANRALLRWTLSVLDEDDDSWETFVRALRAFDAGVADCRAGLPETDRGLPRLIARCSLAQTLVLRVQLGLLAADVGLPVGDAECGFRSNLDEADDLLRVSGRGHSDMQPLLLSARAELERVRDEWAAYA